MGAFSDINGVMSNGYEVVYNNDRRMFKDNSAKNLFSSTNYYPIGRRENTYNEQTEWNSNPPPYLDYQVLPNYITDASYLFFLNGGGDAYLNLQFSDKLKNVSHMFAYCPTWEGAGTSMNANNGIHGVSFPNSIEDATGLFKCCSFGYGRATNFIRNMPQNLISLNNTFFCAYRTVGLYLPLKDSNNNFILGKYENLFNIWSSLGPWSSLPSSSTSNWTYAANENYCNKSNGYDDRRFFNSTIPDNVEYMNGTFALTSIGIDDWELVRENNIDFHLPNNLKDASFCFFETGYLNNFRFDLPNNLTEANWMFSGNSGSYFPNRVFFGEGLVNAVGMFAHYGGSVDINSSIFPQTELPTTLKNARQMFCGCSIYKLFDLPRTVEDASFMYSPCGHTSLYGIQDCEYTIPNTVKNIDFMFANIDISPSNYYLFCKNLFFGVSNPLENFEPGGISIGWTSLNNFNLYFEENSNLNSLTGLFLGINLNNCYFEVPNNVKDISFLMYESGSYFNTLGGEIFFNNVLKENIENAAWAFTYGYCNHNLNIYIPSKLKNAAGTFSRFYSSDDLKTINFIGLEDSCIENAAFFLNGTYCFNQPINFPNTVKDLSYSLYGCSNFIGEYPVEGQSENWVFSLENFTNLEKCDGLFGYCSNFNVNVTFPNSLTSMKQVFAGCISFNQNILLPEGLVSAYQLFSGCSDFDQAIQLPQTLENAAYLFDNCSNFNFGGEEVLDFSYLLNLKDMSYMFNGCYNLNKVINEQTFYWPPSVEKISSLFNGCPNVEFETFTIPSTIKNGSNILIDVTITNSIIIENMTGTLSTPFGNLKGKEIGADGNYYINSIIIGLGNGNISTQWSSPCLFYNTNVNNIIFKDGNLNMMGYDYNNNFNSIGFFIYNSNKFNGNILFDNVDYINASTGRFSISYCNNFNKPITFPTFIGNTRFYDSNNISYLILVESPDRDYTTSSDGILYPGNNFLILTVNQDAPEGTGWRATLWHNFAENNIAFKEALNSLINNTDDIINIYKNRNNFPICHFYTTSDNLYNVKNVISQCEIFNSPLSFNYGTKSIASVVSNCNNFNSTIEIPSSVEAISRLVYYCNNYNQLVVIPGSVKITQSLFEGCKKINTAPLLGEGILSLTNMLSEATLYNKRIFLPDSLVDARFLLSSCLNYNQETDFKGARSLAGALRNCYNYNSVTTFGYTDYRGVNNLFEGDYQFNKEIDFNTKEIVNASYTFYNCNSFNSNVINCNFTNLTYNYFERTWQIFNDDNSGSINKALNDAFKLRGYNTFYYEDLWNAIQDQNFYDYDTISIKGQADRMFYGCHDLKAEILPNFINCGSTEGTFYGCSNFNSPVNLFETESLNNTFYGCSNFNQPLIFNSPISKIGNAFYCCDNLSYIPKFLKGIIIYPDEQKFGDEWHLNSQNAFYHCSNLGKGQQGEEYTIDFPLIDTGYDFGDKQKAGKRFFEGCTNLNVPLNIDKIENIPDYFLYGCSNFNSNIYINRNAYEYCENDYYEIRFEGVSTFAGCYNYNKLFILNGNSYFLWFGGEEFFNGCSNYNQPIQTLFSNTIFYNEVYPNGYLDLTQIEEGTFYNCAIFNQPILQYYFDNDIKNTLDGVSYPTSLYLNFAYCNNFNQPIQGEIKTHFSHWHNTEDHNWFIHSYLPYAAHFNFTNCFVPNGIVSFDTYDINANTPSWTSDLHVCNLGLNFGFMKVSNQETNRTMYFNSVLDVVKQESKRITYTVNLKYTSCVYDDRLAIGDLDGYDYFYPENFYIDFKRNNTQIPLSVLISPDSAFFASYNLSDFSSRYAIKNFNWFPSAYNDIIVYSGEWNSSNSNYSRTSTLFYGVDLEHIDVWNSIFNRNNITYFNYLKSFFVYVHNLNQDFNFNSDTNLSFNNCDNVFDFLPDCHTNIYINTFDYFNRVNTFLAEGDNTNVYIAEDLYFENTIGFFRNEYRNINDSSKSRYHSGNYYIGSGTVFNNVQGGLPCELRTELNIKQFICPQGYDLSHGNYIFDITNSTELNLSDCNFKPGAFYNTNLHTNMLIINNIPYNTQDYWYPYQKEEALFRSTRSLFNVKISPSYSGDIYFCNTFFISDSTINKTYLKSINVIDDTDTYMRVYVKRGTSLYSQLSNFRRGINIFQNTSYNTRNSNFENGITYTQDSDGIYYYNTRQGVYYNIYWY